MSINSISPFISSLLKYKYCSGMCIGIIHNNTFDSFCFGSFSYSSSKSITCDSIFEIGSISKVFTCLMISELIQQNKLSLNDPIDKYITNIQIPSYKNKKITIKHLATHTSGLPRLVTNHSFSNSLDPYKNYNINVLYSFLSSYLLEKEPGIDYLYSNCGMDILGHIVTIITKKSYQESLQDIITNTLQMNNTTLFLNKEQQELFVPGHDGCRQIPNWTIYDSTAGSGAIRSNVSDMLKFISCQLYNDNNKLNNAIQLSQQCHYSKDRKIGLGWHFYKNILWHNGGTGGYRSFTGFDKNNKQGIIILSNGEQSVDDIGLHWLDNTYKIKEIQKIITLPSNKLEEFVGNYKFKNFIIMNIDNKDGQLYCQLPNQQPFSIFLKEKDKFFVRDIEAEISFKRNKENIIQALILHQNGLNQEAIKQNDSSCIIS